MLPFVTASQISSTSLGERFREVQSEKLSFSRPLFTSRATIHETGAMWLYHGHLVSFE